MSLWFWVANFGSSFVAALGAVVVALHLDLEGRWQRQRAKSLDKRGRSR
jgi:hypothetical protein